MINWIAEKLVSLAVDLAYWIEDWLDDHYE